MAKYEQVDASKEPPKESGWYKVGCDPHQKNATQRYFSVDTGEWYCTDDGDPNQKCMHIGSWWRKIPKQRPTTGLTAVQALKAMHRGECVQTNCGGIYKWNGAFYQYWDIEISVPVWHPASPDFNWFLKQTFAIVPGPSKEPEREVFGFGEFYSRLCAGKTCGVATGKATYKMVNGNVQDTAFNETCPLTADWQNFQYYEVQG